MIRTHLGDFMVVAAGLIASSASAIHTEFTAARQAVRLVQHGWSEDCQIIFEGNASLVVASMRGQEEDSSPYGL